MANAVVTSPLLRKPPGPWSNAIEVKPRTFVQGEGLRRLIPGIFRELRRAETRSL